ncbi:hypothetical protein KSP40_PGU009376 [Platanthera guangdongensis]|uniref:Ribosomal protein S14 n=1 Tax=Platanthera guangdongensis TaxID=2320717 RepID=A0ABR2LPM4_9ASPA
MCTPLDHSTARQKHQKRKNFSRRLIPRSRRDGKPIGKIPKTHFGSRYRAAIVAFLLCRRQSYFLQRRRRDFVYSFLAILL